jgi:hypothetical protein
MLLGNKKERSLTNAPTGFPSRKRPRALHFEAVSSMVSGCSVEHCALREIQAEMIHEPKAPPNVA